MRRRCEFAAGVAAESDVVYHRDTEVWWWGCKLRKER